MSFRRAVMLVIRREFGERVRQRAFQIGTVVTVLIVAAIAAAAGLLGGDGEKEYTVGAQGAEAVAIAESAARRRTGLRHPPRGQALHRRCTGARRRTAEDVDAAIVGGELVSQGSPARRARAGAAGGDPRRARSRDPAPRGPVASRRAARAGAAGPAGARARRRRGRGAQGRGVHRLPAAVPAAHHLRPRRRVGRRRGEVLARHRGAHGGRPAARAAGRQDPRHRPARAACSSR